MTLFFGRQLLVWAHGPKGPGPNEKFLIFSQQLVSLTGHHALPDWLPQFCTAHEVSDWY